jgi:hypothetical protein
MTITIILWVVGIHLLELIGLGIFLLVRRNNALEKVATQQQEYINAISIVIQNSDEALREMEIAGAMEADDEVGVFFRNLKEIQNQINQFNVSKN